LRIGEHCGGEEEARSLEGPTAAQQSSAASHRVFDEPGEARLRRVVDHWTDRDVRRQPAADREATHLASEPFRERRCNRLMHQEAVRGGARLPAVAGLRHQRTGHGRIEVRVLEDDERRVSAELHRDPQQLGGGLLHEEPAHGRRPREGELARPGVAHQRFHDRRRPGGGEQVHDTGRHSGLLQQLDE
jgi:hypothetical protein